MVAGVPRYADEYYARKLAPAAYWAAVNLDGKPKMLESGLARALSVAHASEPGLDIVNFEWRAA